MTESRRERRDQMAKEDLLPFKYDSKTNTVFNTSGAKIVPLTGGNYNQNHGYTRFSISLQGTPSLQEPILTMFCRLAAWYVLYMIFWACPPDVRLEPSAPPVCRRF